MLQGTYPTLSQKSVEEVEFGDQRYTRNQARNIIWLAAKHMDFSEKQVMKLSYSTAALDFFHEQLLQSLDEIGDIELFLNRNTHEQREFAKHLHFVLETIRYNNLNLTHLLAQLMKSSFQHGDILDSKKVEVNRSWLIFKDELKAIFDKCLLKKKQKDLAPEQVERTSESGEKFTIRINAIAKQYDFQRIDPKEVMNCLLAFLGQLTKVNHVSRAKAVHNLFYVLRQIVNSYKPDGGMTAEQIGAIIRITLRDGLKLTNQICITHAEEARSSGVLTELEFISKIAEIAMKSESFEEMYEGRMYRGDHYFQAAHTARVDLENHHQGNYEKGLVKKMKAVSIGRRPTPDDSLIIHRSKLQPEEIPTNIRFVEPKKEVNSPTTKVPFVPGFATIRLQGQQLSPRGNEISPRKRSFTQAIQPSSNTVTGGTPLPEKAVRMQSPRKKSD